jgi:2-aminoethylphosphonate-pyruvate transaminase
MPALLLTPGPLTTSSRTRAALGRDWGSRDGDFTALSEGVRARLAALAGVAGTHVAVPLPGSGTFAVEAAVQTLVPRRGKLLVLVNGSRLPSFSDCTEHLAKDWLCRQHTGELFDQGL